MGICYSYQSSWQQENIQKQKRNTKTKNQSVIIQQNSTYSQSFTDVMQSEFRQSLHQSVTLSTNSVFQSSLAMGSIVQMSMQQQQNLLKTLAKLNLQNPIHSKQPIRLCNFKTKNFLHTHKIKLDNRSHHYEVSCCPYNSTHTIQYDVWQLQQKNQNQFYIYHPFTKNFLGRKQYQLFTSQNKQIWKLHSLGPRRNLGFIRIQCQKGWVCMSDDKGMVKNHRKAVVCGQFHISHLWQIIFCDDIKNSQY